MESDIPAEHPKDTPDAIDEGGDDRDALGDEDDATDPAAGESIH